MSTEEVEGFLEGVAHRVARAPEEKRGAWMTRLQDGRAALENGDLVSAERTLVDLDREMDENEEEPELSEFPRGLVGYVPKGDRGAPTQDEEEPLANRLRLIGRLVEVRRAQGRAVEPWLATLTRAREALVAGDRATARRLCDAVHSAIEVEGEPPAARET